MSADKHEVGLKVVFWGTYDLGKPRVRLLLSAAERVFSVVGRCHVPLWSGLEDKSQLQGFFSKLRIILRWLFACPKLVWQYLMLPPHDVVIIPYLGQADIFVLYPFAKARGASIYLDLFISLYDALVIDRQLVKRKSLLATLVFAWEWMAVRLADTVIMDTEAHARYIELTFGLNENDVKSVWVGAERSAFASGRSDRRKPEGPLKVLFYGQFIPLHGIEVIVGAADIARSRNVAVEWTIIGTGQLQQQIDAMIEEKGLTSIKRIQWVDYEDLVEQMNNADICLGIFGATGKAMRVIPNKVYQVLAAGKPLVTADSPAIRELLSESPAVCLVQPGSPEALLDGVMKLASRMTSDDFDRFLGELPIVDEVVVGNQLLQLFPAGRET